MIQQIWGFLWWVKHESQAISPGLVFGSPFVPEGERPKPIRDPDGSEYLPHRNRHDAV